MSISVICPQCGKSYDIPDSRAGQTGKCSCGATMTIPSPEGQVEAPAAPWQTPSQAAPPTRTATRPPVEPRSPYMPPPTQSPYGAPPSPYGPPQGQQSPYGPPPGAIGRPMAKVSGERPMALTVMLIVVALFSVLSAIYSITQAQQLTSRLGAMMPNASAYSAGQTGGTIFWCVARLTLLFNIWNGRNWTRIFMIVVSALYCGGAILGFMAIALGGSVLSPIITLIVYVSFIVVLCLGPTRDYCTQ